MSVMRAPEAWADDRVFTVEDLEDMPDDEFRYELDDGALIVSPAPFPVTIVPADLVATGSG